MIAVLKCKNCNKELSPQEIQFSTMHEVENNEYFCIDCRIDNEPINEKQTQREYQVFEENDSRIFPEGEIKILKKLFDGEKVKDEGTISGRIKPRIREIISVWFPRKKLLQKIIGTKKHRKV